MIVEETSLQFRMSWSGSSQLKHHHVGISRLYLDIWYNLSLVVYRELVEFMPRGTAAVLQAKDGATRYCVDSHQVLALHCTHLCDSINAKEYGIQHLSTSWQEKKF